MKLLKKRAARQDKDVRQRERTLSPHAKAIVDGEEAWRPVKGELYTRPGYVNCDSWELALVTPNGEIQTFLYIQTNGLGGVGARPRRRSTVYPL